MSTSAHNRGSVNLGDPWIAAFLRRIEVADDGCWMWQGQRGERYGRFYAGDSSERWAHRIAYHLHHGHPVPEGLTVDHLCRETFCVNPLHMEAVTQAENNRRAAAARLAVERHDAAGYQRGCRCATCRAALAEVAVERRAERRRQFAAGEIDIEHGTAHGYRYYLCRCASCSAAGLAEARDRRRQRGAGPRRQASHGTLNMYSRHGCRCADCRAANAAHHRAYRARKAVAS